MVLRQFYLLWLVGVTVFHRAFMYDIRFSQLQHIFSHWKDISCDLSSAWTPEDMLGFGLRIHSSQEPLQLAQCLWNFDSGVWDGFIFVRVRIRKPAESRRDSHHIYPGLTLFTS